jgi:hypothetical protein
VTANAPPGMTVTAPKTVALGAGASKTINITVTSSDMPYDESRFATLTFTRGALTFTFPITVVRFWSGLDFTTSCTPASIPARTITSCTIDVGNGWVDTNVSLTDVVPYPLKVVPGSVVGATLTNKTLTWSGPLASGERHTITFTARGTNAKSYVNTVRLTGDAFPGVQFATFAGVVTRRT